MISNAFYEQYLSGDYWEPIIDYYFKDIKILQHKRKLLLDACDFKLKLGAFNGQGEYHVEFMKKHKHLFDVPEPDAHLLDENSPLKREIAISIGRMSNILREQLFHDASKEFEDKKHLNNFCITAPNINWESCKELAKDLTGIGFITHQNNVIIGKPQEIKQTLQTLTLVRLYERVVKEIPYQTVCFLDDVKDKRKLGDCIATVKKDYFLYKLVYKSKEYIVASRNKLTSQEYSMRGMIVNVTNSSEVSKDISLSSSFPIFFVESVEPTIKVMEQKELVEFIKHNNYSKEDLLDYLFSRRDGYVYRQPENFEKMLLSILLSGKFESYPLNFLHIGPSGKGKSVTIENITDKYDEEEGIYEAGNSTLKGLIPSFKEKIADPGHILKCNRIAAIDEIFKMINNAKNEHKHRLREMLSQLNMLLEHKRRTIGSGNANRFSAQATAKVYMVANPLSKKSFLSDHIGIIDESTLNRFLIYIQNPDHIDFINEYEPYEYKKNTLTLTHIYTLDTKKKKTQTHSSVYIIVDSNLERKNNKKNIKSTYICVSVNVFFLSVVDSLNAFIVDFDRKKVKTVVQTVKNTIEDNKLKRLFMARGEHHSVLLLDGIVKQRVLFEKANNFDVKEEDYVSLENLLMYITESWTTKMTVDDSIETDFEPLEEE